MKQLMILSVLVVLVFPIMANTTVNTFGKGDNQFTIEFVTISANPGETRSTNTSGQTVQTFTNGTVGHWIDPGYNYRMGKFQITNDQFTAFEAETGMSFRASYWTGDEIPVNRKNWYAAAQFVNWLNTSNDHQAAYNFDGGTFTAWDATDAWGGTNLYRHKNAYYFLPTEDEWAKAAYWDGIRMQTWATINGTQPVAGVDSRYGYSGGPWAVGSGTEELNDTFDMMGNVWEWMESPYFSGDYLSGSTRGIRGGGCTDTVGTLSSSFRFGISPHNEPNYTGFRVVSVPEPASLVLLGLGGLALRYRKR